MPEERNNENLEEMNAENQNIPEETTNEETSSTPEETSSTPEASDATEASDAPEEELRWMSKERATIELIRATFRCQGFWRKEKVEQKAILEEFFAAFKAIWGIEFEAAIDLENAAMYQMTGGGRYSPQRNKLYIFKPSVMTILHELKHVMHALIPDYTTVEGSDAEGDCVLWSHTMFRMCMPRLYEKSMESGKFYHRPTVLFPLQGVEFPEFWLDTMEVASIGALIPSVPAEPGAGAGFSGAENGNSIISPDGGTVAGEVPADFNDLLRLVANMRNPNPTPPQMPAPQDEAEGDALTKETNRLPDGVDVDADDSTVDGEDTPS